MILLALAHCSGPAVNTKTTSTENPVGDEQSAPIVPLQCKIHQHFERVDKAMETQYNKPKAKINEGQLLADLGKIRLTPQNTCRAKDASWGVSEFTQYESYFEKKAFFYRNAKANFYDRCLGGQDAVAAKVITFRKESCGHHSNVNYKVSYEKKLVNLQLRLGFVYDGKKENREKALIRLENTTLCAKNFYAKLGLNLRLEYSFAYGFRAPNIISIHDQYPYNSNSENWDMFRGPGWQDEDKPFGLTCSVVVHELAHLMGLDDARCNASLASKNSIMGMSITEISTQDLSDKEIHKIIAPICQ